MNRIIDHIVYAVLDLEAAMQDFEAKTGVRPVFGGYHQTQGTKNALVNLGNTCYLEFLAIDEANTSITAPRWMGIDSIKRPQITRWALQSEDLARDSQILQAYQAEMGKLQAGQRNMSNGKMLTWQMTMPLAEPTVEIMPFFLDWRESEVYPTEQLAAQCRLLELKLRHPTPAVLQAVFQQLDLDMVVLEGEAAIHLRLESPKGVVLI